MKIKTIPLFSITLVIFLALPTLQGCTTLSTMDTTAATAEIPPANPMLDHYIAWVPRAQAQTATVAEAMAHISLANAREQTANQLCAGQWMARGAATDNIGPLPATAPATAGGYPAWYYRISHRPGMHGCHDTDAQTLYHAMQENLPHWMNIRTATTTTLSQLD